MAFILAASAPAADIAGAKLATIGRGMWSMPPDHGAGGHAKQFGHARVDIAHRRAEGDRQLVFAWA